MSFFLTTDQIRDQSKTVTRRKGWKFLKVGEVINACAKCQGIKKGTLEVICQIRVVDVRREELWKIGSYGYDDTRKEGFPGKTPGEFLAMFLDHMGGEADQEVTRIEFEYV